MKSNKTKQTMNFLKKISSLGDSPKKRMGLIIFSALMMSIASYMALVWAPNALGEPVTYRILYFHIPSAIMTYLGFFITFVGGIGYLWKKDAMYDRWAVVGADLGVHFCFLVLVTGMIWGKQRWGAWWLWEPRLTSSLVLLIIFVGYLILRHVIEAPETKARYASVYGIIGFVDVPLVHYAIKMWGKTVHPVVIKSAKDTGLSPDMMVALRVSMLAFIIAFISLYIIRLQIEKNRAKLEFAKSISQEE